MTFSEPDFHIITGGPGSGKTTLVEALGKGGMAIVPEVGRQIILEQQAIGGSATHGGDRALFSELMLTRAVGDYERYRGTSGPVVFDRGIPELVGYRRLSGLPVPDHFRNAAAVYRYAPTVFLAPPWPGIYRNDSERKQSLEEALATYEAVRVACNEAGYDLVELPLVSVAERVAFVRARIG